MTSAPGLMAGRPASPPADVALAGLPIEVADSIAACQRLREPWLRLRERCGVQSPNTDPDRFLAVVGALADALPHVVMFGPPESPRAMIVARCSRRRAAYRIGYVTFRSPTLRCLDIAYEGLLTDRQTGALSMTTEYLDGLLACGGVDLVSFNHLRTGQAEQMAAGAPRSILHSSDIHWRFQLVPGSYEQTIAGFSKKHRYNMRRADRLLVERFGGHVCLRIFAQKQELDEFIPQASRITAQSYHGGLGVGFVDNAVTRALVSAEARAGRLRCYWLEAEGKPIAHQVGCLYGDTYHLLATSFLPQYRELSPGHVLLVRVIEDLCGVGMRWIDYGFGDADYKRIYGTESWSEQTVRLYGRTARATLAWTLDVATTRGAAWLRAAAKRLGAIRRLKNTWRRRLTRDHTR